MRPKVAAPLLTAASAVLALSGCGGGSSPASPSASVPTPAPASDTRTIQEDPSFSATIQEIFVRRSCASGSCHGAALAAGLDLRSEAAYTALVGVTATTEPIVRVIAGDPDNSYLVMKLEGRQSVGVRMPLGFAPLDDIDLTNIRNWIAQSAKNN
jgi:hypothetical protein